MPPRYGSSEDDFKACMHVNFSLRILYVEINMAGQKTLGKLLFVLN